MADRIGKFQILSVLGEGANSKILHVRREADGREYALKIVCIEEPEDQKYLEQARHEHRVAGMLDHANIVRVPGFEVEKDWLFRPRKATLLVEYVPGKTLDRLPPLPAARLVPVFLQTAGALVHMHRKGVFHADLKPNNLMLTPRGQVKVIDFGLAWVHGEPKDRVQGTPEYMAPETASHKLINERTDIFNFGATMYRLLTLENVPNTVPVMKEMPIKAEDWQKSLKPVRSFNPRVPEKLAELVQRCVCFKATARPERMTEVQSALDRLNDEFGEQAETD